ncbi:hypothetical protein BOX15_Mlig000800g2 [Macrostomum lignano]|uniref:CHK kinase-like domain-containing protein n=1 Tax=Macrostomum lignano TaxID=282301 RepID=A0A267EJ75_9PLAT|nr:hypothetical protein BOX15_Mlig000800g2 [Macrostomum lignano]
METNGQMDFRAILSRLFSLTEDEADRCIASAGEEMTGETGFLSYRRRLKVKKGDSTINVFLKFSDTTRQDSGELKELMDCFCPRECLFYGTFAPLLERTASQLGLGSIGLPTVHLEMVLPTGTLIVMEDLGEAGFELAPATMNVAEARCVLSSLARVQAAFWLTKARLGSPASGLFGPQSPLSDGFFALSATKKSMDELLPAGFELFRREFAKYMTCDKRIAIINGYLDRDYLKKAQQVIKSGQEEREVVGITHSDLWYNNCMLSRDASGQPVECRLIDWQVFGIGRLTFDLGPFWISSIDNAIAVEQYLPCVELYDETIRSLYKTGLQQEFPVSKETIRKQAVQSLNWGITWLVTFAEMIPVLRRIDNVLNNVADLIEHFGL